MRLNHLSCLALVTLTYTFGTPVPNPGEDFHFPSEEQSEARAAHSALKVISIDASSNQTGSIILSVQGATPVNLTAPGDSAAGWALRSFIVTRGSQMAVIERDWNRWGLILYLEHSTTVPARLPATALSPAGSSQYGSCPYVKPDNPRVGCFVVRKGVGMVSQVRRPLYTLEKDDPAYFTTARDSPTDWLKERMVDGTVDGEPTFESAAALLPPARDYVMVGNVDSHTKFAVSPDGRVKHANYSIYTPMEAATVAVGHNHGLFLFDPANLTSYWPVHNFSDYKTALLGRHSRAVSVAAWDVSVSRGFVLTATPNTRRGIQTEPFDHAEIMLRLVEFDGNESSSSRYLGVLSCTSEENGWVGMPVNCHCGNESQHRELQSSEFYSELLAHTLSWSSFHDTKTAMQVWLDSGQDNSEGTRMVDMARAVITSSMSMWVGLRPDYGDGTSYWSLSQKDRGSLPLESFALNRALLLWGHTMAAADRVEFYLNTYVRNESGITPTNLPGMNRTVGPAGSLDLKQWGPCSTSNQSGSHFDDGFADYGRWIELWVEIARDAEAKEGGRGFIGRTWKAIQGLTNYTFGLHDSAMAHPLPDPAEGLIKGPAEHDTCRDEAPFFSINAWTWRGWVALRRFLTDTSAINGTLAYIDKLDARIKALAEAMHLAVNRSLVQHDGRPYFLPPYAAANFTPYKSMLTQGGFAGNAAYANFRYFAEMLSSEFFSIEIASAINDFRESHTGTLSGMTRFTDHLDDMPAEGYAHSAIALRRVSTFQSLYFGHIANYHSRGTFNAPEQLSLYGDGVKGVFTYADSYRAYFNPEMTEVDIDFCVPSTALPATMLRWMLVYTERDNDTIALFRALPKRFFRPSGKQVIRLADAPTRYGTVGTNVTVSPATSNDTCPQVSVAMIRLELHGRGFIQTSRELTLEVRLRTYGGCNNAHLLRSVALLDGKSVDPESITVSRDETVSIRIQAQPGPQTVELRVVGYYGSND